MDLDFDQFLKVVEAIANFLLEIVKLPAKEDRKLISLKGAFDD